MPRIPSVHLATASEKVRPLFEGLKKKLGTVPNLFATIGQSPEALQALLGATEALGHGALSGREVEQVNLLTSELNGCAYCISAHGALGKLAGLSPDDIEAARAGRGANTREQAILALVQRVVRTGGAGAGTDLTRAREAGLSDAEVIEVLAHIALKTFTNAVGILAQTDIDFPKQPRLPQA
jgi:uncharacterized peroxidase-related enzyme